MEMECALSTWPCITQFDDLTWMGLGDIDPLESLDRTLEDDCQLSGASSANHDERNSASSDANVALDDIPSQIRHTKIEDFYRLTSAESLAAARWESINADDLASVLDSFPSNKDVSTLSEDGAYDMYSDSINMQEDSPFSGEVDAFMSAAMSETPETKNTMLHSDEKASIHDETNRLSSNCSAHVQNDARCESSMVDNQSRHSLNVSAPTHGSLSQSGMTNASQSELNYKSQNVKHVTDDHGGPRADLFQASQYFAIQPMNMHGFPNFLITSPDAMDMGELISPQHQECLHPSMMMHWSKFVSTDFSSQLYSRKQATAQLHNSQQVVQQTPTCIGGNNYKAIIEQQAVMADAARVTSDLKHNRAQASRARRLAASQRRAKKYPLQKLIRMSSSSACVREKLDLGSATVPHRSPQLPSPGMMSSMAQLPTFLPLCHQGTDTSSHALKPVESTLKYHYHHPAAAFCEDNPVSSSVSSPLQTQHNGQNMHASSSLPLPSTSNISETTDSLDTALLNQLQSIISKMNVDMRFCIRDALYRLARSAHHRQSRTENVLGLEDNERQLQAMETNTNSMDRWIVNMLFCKQAVLPEAKSQQNVAESPSQSVDNANISSSTQQWNSCGSSVNL